nr:hypothetical protein [Pantoea sp. 1B4]
MITKTGAGGRLHFSPARHLSTPDTPLFRRGVNPRVIDDPVWLKLIWASLNLRQEDLLTEIHYPLAMLQAMAVIWTHAGGKKERTAPPDNRVHRAAGGRYREGRRKYHPGRNPVLPAYPCRKNLKSLC